MRDSMKKIFLLWTMSVLAVSLSAENIRGPVSGTLNLNGETKIQTRIENLCGITLPKISPLIQGIKISVYADQDMEIYRNSFALYIYKNLNGLISKDRESYEGTQVFMHFLPFSDPINILVPLDNSHTLSPDRSTYLLSDTDMSKSFPLIMTILPITKGIPDSVYNKEITVEITPVYFNKGSVQLNIMNDQGVLITNDINISIDNKKVEWPGGPYILSSGIHNLSIRTNDGNEDSFPFTLASGQNLNIDHVLQYQRPVLSIETMKGLSVYLDGRLLDENEIKESFEINPGSHSIIFELGDFKISRDFTAEMQQRISITMVPEILLDYR